MKIQKLIGLFALLVFVISSTNTQAQRINNRAPAVVKTSEGYQLNGLKMSPADQNALLNLLRQCNPKSYSLVINDNQGLRTYGQLPPQTIRLVNKTRTEATSSARKGLKEKRTWAWKKDKFFRNEVWIVAPNSDIEMAIDNIMKKYL